MISPGVIGMEPKVSYIYVIMCLCELPMYSFMD